MSGFLHFLENEIQLAALSFLLLIYAMRLIWLFRLCSRREKTYAAGSAAAGIARSLLNIATPWSMESTRRHPGFYLQFVVFHLGVTAAITLSFIIPYAPQLLEQRWRVRSLQTLIGAALLVGLIRFGRRLVKANLRRISGIDDFLSLLLVILFFLTAIMAAPNRFRQSEWPLVAFFGLTALLLVYVPFSKIGHYLYYPFSRFFFGRQLGHRGVTAKKKNLP